MEICKSDIDNIKLFALKELIIVIAVLICIYLLYIELTLYKFSKHIWRTKTLLSLMPIEIMVSQIDVIKPIIKDLS